MNDLTTDYQRLMLHAHFEEVCQLPKSRAAILHMCDLLRAADPEFFSDNGAFEGQSDDDDYNYMDFELAVEMLKQIHLSTLFVDNSPGYAAALNHFGVPQCANERHRGDTVSELLSALQSYISFDVRMVYLMDDSKPDTPQSSLSSFGHVDDSTRP